MSVKKKRVIKKKKPAPKPQATWDDAIDLAKCIDGIIRSTALGVLKLKENSEFMAECGDSAKGCIDLIVKAIVPLKNELKEIANTLPTETKVTVTEDQFPHYYVAYSNLVLLNEELPGKLIEPFSILTSMSLEHDERKKQNV
jgi:hypothetical protein